MPLGHLNKTNTYLIHQKYVFLFAMFGAHILLFRSFVGIFRENNVEIVRMRPV